jgi:hypothetical protein
LLARRAESEAVVKVPVIEADGRLHKQDDFVVGEDRPPGVCTVDAKPPVHRGSDGREACECNMVVVRE